MTRWCHAVTAAKRSRIWCLSVFPTGDCSSSGQASTECGALPTLAASDNARQSGWHGLYSPEAGPTIALSAQHVWHGDHGAFAHLFGLHDDAFDTCRATFNPLH
jgi:hypothetical protein